MKMLHIALVVTTTAALVSSTLNAQANPTKLPNIAQIVVSNPDVTGDGQGDFNILLTAVGLADPSVLQRLASNGQNTVFAPTDAAFLAAFEELEALGYDVANILANTDLLTLILNYHISPGLRTSATVVKSPLIRMRDGGFLRQQAGVLTDNVGREAGIILTDLRAGNGIIHVIDTVVLPALP
jgi:uncharacterized surface protein with fasciclin (FAS1) repeats